MMPGLAKPKVSRADLAELERESAADKARPARILCVDDEPAVLTILTRALGRRFEIVTMDDPVAALSLIERGADFSVVISDMRMPQMDGAEFLSRVKRLLPSSSRMALTACLERELDPDQVFGILTKPCPLALLQESVTAAVQHHLLLTRPDSVLPVPLPHEIQLMSTAPPGHEDLISGIRSKHDRLSSASLAQLGAAALADGGLDISRESAGALSLLGTVAEKFLMLGQGADAERILKAPLLDLEARVQLGLGPPASDLARAAALALRLAEQRQEPSWLDYVCRVYLAACRPLPHEVIERMHGLIRQMAGIDRSLFREYLATLRAARGFNPADQFLVRRIEGLEPLLR
jgi:CheY-like chemotaxis protein